MSLRLASTADGEDIDAFLGAHADTSMFLRFILRAFGTDERSQPAGTQFYLWCPEDRIEGVFGLTNEGIVLAQHPGNTPSAFRAFAQSLQGQQVTGMTGVSPTMGHVLEALGLGDAPYSVNVIEPLYALEADTTTDDQAFLRGPTEDDLALLTRWFAIYESDLGLAKTEQRSDAEAQLKAHRAIAGGATRLMEENGAPVAMATIHARAGDRVQIGDVFVPPEQRGRGLAGQVIRAFLAELRETGARRALLAANNAAAARSYEKIGAQQVADQQTGLLTTSVTIGPIP